MGNSDDGKQILNNAENETSSRPQVDAATVVQLQPFWPGNPRTWFQLADIQFNAAKTSAFNRYTKTLASLPVDICDRIPDIIANPPTQDHYENLRDRLIERLAPSDERQVEALLAGEQLGDRKPSEALIRIQTLAGANFSTKIIRSLWIRKMPPLIKLALVAQNSNTDITESAHMADKMFEILPTNNIDETTKRPSRSFNSHPKNTYRSNRDGNHRSPVSSVEDRLTRIEAQLAKVLSQRNSRSRERRFSSRTRSNSSNRSRDLSASHGPTADICWFHDRFGRQARRCRQPCKFGQSTSKAAMDIDQAKNL